MSVNWLTKIRERLARRLQPESGWVLVTAVAVTAAVVGLGLAVMSVADTQQHQSGQERQRESSFDVGEAGLYSEEFQLGFAWPTKQTQQFPLVCTQATTQANCPTPAALRAAMDSSNLVDLRNAEQWTIRVRDDKDPPNSDVYDSTIMSNDTTWDKNGDHKMWVRVDAVVQGHTRSLVALLQLEQFPEQFPQNVITAGSVHIENSGNKVLVDTTGSQVVVRCTPGPKEPSQKGTCEGWDPGQVSPQTSYQSVPTTPPAMDPSELDRFRTTAQTNGTYYANQCPTDLNGQVVFIDFTGAAGSCSYTSNPTINSPSSPGIIIINNGSLTLGGKLTYYGLVYATNPTNCSCTLVKTEGNSTIVGGVAVDGNGIFDDGDSGKNIVFAQNAFTSLYTFGTAGLVQSTWRELPPNSP